MNEKDLEVLMAAGSTKSQAMEYTDGDFSIAGDVVYSDYGSAVVRNLTTYELDYFMDKDGRYVGELPSELLCAMQAYAKAHTEEFDEKCFE